MFGTADEHRSHLQKELKEHGDFLRREFALEIHKLRERHSFEKVGCFLMGLILGGGFITLVWSLST